MYNELKKAVEVGTISRKTACRIALKNGLKNEYVALLLGYTLDFVNRLIDTDDRFIDSFDGTEIKNLI